MRSARLWNSKSSGALLLLDLDHFKRVNDLHGHLAGDMLLKQVADTLVKHSPQGSCCARIGGDEFVVLLEGATSQRSRGVRPDDPVEAVQAGRARQRAGFHFGIDRPCQCPPPAEGGGRPSRERLRALRRQARRPELLRLVRSGAGAGDDRPRAVGGGHPPRRGEWRVHPLLPAADRSRFSRAGGLRGACPLAFADPRLPGGGDLHRRCREVGAHRAADASALSSRRSARPRPGRRISSSRSTSRRSSSATRSSRSTS